MKKKKLLNSFIEVLISFLISIILFAACETNQNNTKVADGEDWSVYLGDKSSSQYSLLSQINKKNVRKLVPVWEYHSSDFASEKLNQIQCNPIIIGGVLYGTSPKLKVFALDAATGRRIWEVDPDPKNKFAKNVNRGVTYWHNENDKRILFTSGSELFAIDATTGKLVKSFGDFGRVSLKSGLGEGAKDLYVVATTPGIVYQDLLIMGSRVSENSSSAPGYIRAFNIRNGELEWVFHTIPNSGDYGYDTWDQGTYKKAGGANSWAGMSLDEKRGIVYIPTGSAAYDFWGGNRKGENLFANCVLALDAKTGKRIWHYQTIHHDLWDRDLPAPPNLVTVKHDGEKVDAVAQITKTGFVFLLNRDTGEPLFPVDEKPVPTSDLDGEEVWPTQPIPQLPPPFTPQTFSKEDITNISKESHDYIEGIFSGIRTVDIFDPPSTQGTLIFPGFDGGGEWGGAAVDPSSGILYVNSSIMPWILTMVSTNLREGISSGESVYRTNCAVCHGPNLEGNSSGTFPSLKSISEKYSKKEILDIINSGKGFMPSFKYINDKDKNSLVNFLSNEKGESDQHMAGVESNYKDVPYSHTGYNRFLDPNGYPAIKPLWGILSAIDLNEGAILWQVPLGEYKELTEMGIPKTGTENFGGPVVTAGGLIFIGSTRDEYFRAFDKDTGEELWSHKLPAGGYATPSVYSVDGKQYVVIACGGGKMGTPSGDSYIAFALSDK